MDHFVNLTLNQAAAIRDDVTEINQHQQVLQAKTTSNKRYIDCIIKDAGLNPEDFQTWSLVTPSGVPQLKLTPKE